jgi:RluA family pseudouridine synthase
VSPAGLTILHEDERLIAVDKPAGRLVIPGRGADEKTLRIEVEEHLGSKAFVVHRLDREASGLVLFAKDAATHRKLCAAFETRKIHKRYRAIVLGRVVKNGVVDSPIRTFGSGRMGVGGTGKPSRTLYRVLDPLSDSTLLEATPETGRRHQIRVHLYSIGHPILGDLIYGDPRPVGGAPRLMLHAFDLRFELDGRRYELRCEPPTNFESPRT